MKQPITLTLSTNVYEALDRLASREERSRSQQANLLLKQALEARGALTPPAVANEGATA
jgi:hypothetical protein